jgi:integrase
MVVGARGCTVTEGATADVSGGRDADGATELAAIEAGGGPAGGELSQVRPQLRPERRPELVYLARLGSQESRRVMASRLGTVAEILGFEHYTEVPWEALRYEHLEGLLARLRDKPNEKQPGKKLSPSSINQALAAVRGVCKVARNMGLMPHDAYTLLAEVEPARGKRVKAGRDTDPDELRALMSTILSEPGPRGIRNAAIVALFYSTGLRRAELARLTLEDYQPKTGRLRLLGKGDKERLTYLDEGAEAWLDDWLRARGDKPGPLFVPVDRDGALLWRHMTPEAVYNVVRTWARRAGLERLTPHDFRRTVTGDLLELKEDLSTVADMLGHASTDTTRLYDRRGEERKRRAARRRYTPRDTARDDGEV